MKYFAITFTKGERCDFTEVNPGDFFFNGDVLCFRPNWIRFIEFIQPPRERRVARDSSIIYDCYKALIVSLGADNQVESMAVTTIDTTSFDC